MNTPPLVIERSFNAPVDRVWKALTDKQQLKAWYFDLSGFEPRVGFEFSFSGGDDSNVFMHHCRITEVVPGKILAYTWKYEGKSGQSTVRFELFPEGNGTRLVLTHEGLESFSGHGPLFTRESFTGGWTQIIGHDLRVFVEATE